MAGGVDRVEGAEKDGEWKTIWAGKDTRTAPGILEPNLAGIGIGVRANFEDAGVEWITRVLGATPAATVEFYRGLGFTSAWPGAAARSPATPPRRTSGSTTRSAGTSTGP